MCTVVYMRGRTGADSWQRERRTLGDGGRDRQDATPALGNVPSTGGPAFTLGLCRPEPLKGGSAFPAAIPINRIELAARDCLRHAVSVGDEHTRAICVAVITFLDEVSPRHSDSVDAVTPRR